MSGFLGDFILFGFDRMINVILTRFGLRITRNLTCQGGLGFVLIFWWDDGWWDDSYIHGIDFLDVEPGTLVLLSTPGTAIKDALKKYTGPYRMVKRYSPAVYKIEDLESKRWQVVNQIRLKCYYQPNKVNETNLPVPEPPPKPPPKKKVSPTEALNPAIADEPSFLPKRTHPMVLRSQAQPAPSQANVPATPVIPVQPTRPTSKKINWNVKPKNNLHSLKMCDIEQYIDTNALTNTL
jgi:hypothetical protein